MCSYIVARWVVFCFEKLFSVSKMYFIFLLLVHLRVVATVLYVFFTFELRVTEMLLSGILLVIVIEEKMI